ncbi:MAG: Wzz/FepE/Etk N-terminal domain-containing protein [Bacilli bacterium]|nr:Wzz/FepE/Etk N-terminal domain-containing protein [Bacilli bacterium]
MEEVSLKEMLDYFRSKWLIIFLLPLLIGLIGVFYQIYLQVPKYQSSTTLVLNQVNENSTSITQSDIQINQNLIPTYREIIKSRNILSQVIEKLNLSYDIEELSEMITVSSVSDTELIEITVASDNQEETDNIANEVAQVFEEKIVDIYNIENISVIDMAEEASKPYNISYVKYTIIFVLVGLILGFGIVFMMYYFDNTIKDEKMIEEKLGVPVLGIVPLKAKGDEKRGY